jgi:hypothetical protein
MALLLAFRRPIVLALNLDAFDLVPGKNFVFPYRHRLPMGGVGYPGAQRALIAPVRRFEPNSRPGLALKIVHRDKAVDRLNFRYQLGKDFSESALHPRPDAVLDDASDHSSRLSRGE